jgi:glycosyltransferase involved in cell wall biosynthesis
MYDADVARVCFDEHVFATVQDSVTDTVTRVALIGGFLPRRCGIATFTTDIHAALSKSDTNIAVDVYAMTTGSAPTTLAAPVRAAIAENDPESYAAAAAIIDQSGASLVWLQHEFGLFGGTAGNLVLDLVDQLAVPLVVTMHTVLAHPDAAQMAVMRRLVGRATKLVVMSRRARQVLLSVYGAEDAQIEIIEHGVPDRPFGREAQFKAKYGFSSRPVLMTFGLLSPGKGIEAAIASLPAITARHPDVLYCIVGATHPNLLASEGEAYRNRLTALASSLGVERSLFWVDAFLETSELLDLIEAADIYVTPYPGAEQSTSGTLSYAVAMGKAVVSTPYVHAMELLADDHGVLVPFNDSGALARAVCELLDDPDEMLALKRRAYARGRKMIWPAFGARSLALINKAIVTPASAPAVTTVGLSGLLRICDETGIIQHSIYNVPDRAHGYCVDDNARALMLMNRIDHADNRRAAHLSTIFAAFVQSAWNAEHGRFRNFMDYRRHWLEDAGSADSNARALWALGATAAEGKTANIRRWGAELFDQALASAQPFDSPRATAFAMLGADYQLMAQPSDERATAVLSDGGDHLMALLGATRRPDWTWFESVLAYDNCRLPEALIRAGKRLDEASFSRCGLETLSWIMEKQQARAGHFRPIGSESFGLPYRNPYPFDQQPLEIWAAIDACTAAFDVTHDRLWFDQAKRAYDWFSGSNDRGMAIADPQTGTCCDGLHARGINLNEGAESVLAYQLANCAVRAFAVKLG